MKEMMVTQMQGLFRRMEKHAEKTLKNLDSVQTDSQEAREFREKCKNEVIKAMQRIKDLSDEFNHAAKTMNGKKWVKFLDGWVMRLQEVAGSLPKTDEEIMMRMISKN